MNEESEPNIEIVDEETGEVIEAEEPRYGEAVVLETILPGSKTKLGRRTKLTRSMITRFQKALSTGVSDRVACAFCNINKDTFYTWLRIGREDIDNGREDTIHAQFFEAVEAARATPQIQAAAIVVKAMPEDPRLALEFLKNMPRSEWGKNKLDIKVSATDEDELVETEEQISNVAIERLNTLNTFLELARKRASHQLDAGEGPDLVELPDADGEGLRQLEGPRGDTGTDN